MSDLLTTIPDGDAGLWKRHRALFPDGFRPYPRDMFEIVLDAGSQFLPYHADGNCSDGCGWRVFPTVALSSPEHFDRRLHMDTCFRCDREIPLDDALSGQSIRVVIKGNDVRMCSDCSEPYRLVTP